MILEICPRSHEKEEEKDTREAIQNCTNFLETEGYHCKSETEGKHDFVESFLSPTG